MRGYKVLDKGLCNQYGTKYELNKKYYLDGEVKYRDNGFYFCERPEDTFKFFRGFIDEFDMTEIEASGDIYTWDDEYYGYYDIHASTEMEILRVIPREEMFNSIINSKIEYRVKRLIETLKLTEEEKQIILDMYPMLSFSINYYQNDEFVLKQKKYYGLIS